VHSKLFSAFLVSILASVAFAQSEVQSKLASSSKIADGRANDWINGNTLRFYDSELKLAYDIANDNQHLYLIFQLDRSSGMMQVMKAGIQLKLRTRSKPAHTGVITFPTADLPKKDSSARPKYGQQQQPPALPGNDLLQQLKLAETDGFYFDNGLQPSGDSTGILTAVDRDSSGNVFFEISIPLTELFENPVYFPADMKKALQLEISMLVVPPRSGQQPPQQSGQGMQPPGQENGGQRPSGPPPGGNGRMGPPNGSPGMESSEMAHETRKTIVRKLLFAL